MNANQIQNHGTEEIHEKRIYTNEPPPITQAPRLCNEYGVNCIVLKKIVLKMLTYNHGQKKVHFCMRREIRFKLIKMNK